MPVQDTLRSMNVHLALPGERVCEVHLQSPTTAPKRHMSTRMQVDAAACCLAAAADWERDADYWDAHPREPGATACAATCRRVAADLRVEAGALFGRGQPRRRPLPMQAGSAPLLPLLDKGQQMAGAMDQRLSGAARQLQPLPGWTRRARFIAPAPMRTTVSR
jgi:hypothetical protein